MPGIRFELESPSPGVGAHGWSITLSGWAFSTSGNPEITALCIVAEDVDVARINPGLPRPDVAEHIPDAPDTPGFFLAISALECDTAFSFDVTAERADGDRTILATVRGTRDPIAPARDARFHPVVLNCLGRVGSTWISFLLDRHPEVLAYRPFEFETRTLVYWLEMLKAIGRPRSYFQTFAADLSNPRWWLGDADPAPVRSLPDDQILQWMGGAGVQGLAAFCASQTDGFYARVAHLQEKPRARLFVEKTGHPFHCRAIRELYPDVREIFLVRDFRDMFTSMRQHFAEHLSGAHPDHQLLESVTAELQTYARQWERRHADARLLRYEDLVREPEATLVDLLGWMQVDSSKAIVDAMLAGARASRPDLQAEHRTAASPEESIGRWKRDLPAPLAEACDGALGPLAAIFGY
ncbi:MAG: sulfotransferase [Planctomycetes bacterium]|nr:sulfotransferase [Planctomycetota bacterium]